MTATPRRRTGELRAPLWLAHHPPGQLDRCVTIGHTAVCRRCVVLYPCVLVWWVVALLSTPPAAALVVAAWVLPLPMVGDWVLEHLRRSEASPRRLVAVSAVAAPGFAAMLALHTDRAWDPRALVPAALYGAIALGAAWYGVRRRSDHDDWRSRHLADEARRDRQLRDLLDLQDHVRGADGRLQSGD